VPGAPLRPTFEVRLVVLCSALLGADLLTPFEEVSGHRRGQDRSQITAVGALNARSRAAAASARRADLLVGLTRVDAPEAASAGRDRRGDAEDGQAAGDDGALQPTSSAPPPARPSPRRGPPATTTMKTPAEAAAHLVGARGLQDRRAEDRRTPCPRRPRRQAQQAQPEHVGEPEQRDRQPPAPTASRTATPCRWTRPNQPENSAPTSAPAASAE
jgi:hypothetical protein